MEQELGWAQRVSDNAIRIPVIESSSPIGPIWAAAERVVRLS